MFKTNDWVEARKEKLNDEVVEDVSPKITIKIDTKSELSQKRTPKNKE